MLTNRHNIKPIYGYNDKGEWVKLIIEEGDVEFYKPNKEAIKKIVTKPKFDIKDTWYYKLAQTLPMSELA